jgi:methylated-DNA-[protein]-cysteine S-methyltransferase
MTDTDPLELELRRAARALASDPPRDLELAAARSGLLDIAYASTDSPVGKLLLATTRRGLVRVAYLDPTEEESVLQELANRISPRILSSPRRLDDPRRELEQYFSGQRRRFELPIDWRLTQGFGRRVLSATARIPYGSLASYKEIAGKAGSPRASRAAGNALGANPLPIVVPCHRVVHADGGLGGYTGGLQRKRALLTVERAMR